MMEIVKEYLIFLKNKIYIGVLIVLCCACLGSIRGAWKESEKDYIWITQEDVANMEEAGKTAPLLTGVVGLAAQQNRWLNFDYAFIYGRRGVVIYCALMAVYMLCYRWRFFHNIREMLGKGMEDRLFINLESGKEKECREI